MKEKINKPCFIKFKHPVDNIPLPEKFTYPFNYEPHPLCQIAAEQLQEYLETQNELEHDFGIKDNSGKEALGKMFGLLVVQNTDHETGFLAAYSGKLADGNDHSGFVPPVYNLLNRDGFFKKGETVITEINNQIKKLENDPVYLICRDNFNGEKEYFSFLLKERKSKFKKDRKKRKLIRKQAREKFSEKEFNVLFDKHKKVSLDQQYAYKRLSAILEKRLLKSKKRLKFYTDKINSLKEERKKKSAALQQKIFNQFRFLNAKGEERSLLDIFKDTSEKIPPAGAGECTAPKLLQYAYHNNYTPLAMAEFWWGKSPESEVRKHKMFYPACKSKCKPILEHMLRGLKVDENPLPKRLVRTEELETVYEDDLLLVINKPAEFLSVPGKGAPDSVYTCMRKRLPSATGPLIVHRLDMSTSGLILIAKTEDVYKFLQRQFLNRIIKKRYLALLDGIISENSGFIDLPLRVDLDNRPQQLVCYKYGKPAQTKWEVAQRSRQRTKIYFYPVTGRTHQLRVHAAHRLGLNTPIVGDDLYGKKSNRLYLHAESIEFIHPVSNKTVQIEKPADF